MFETFQAADIPKIVFAGDGDMRDPAFRPSVAVGSGLNEIDHTAQFNSGKAPPTRPSRLGFCSTLVENGEQAVNHFIQAQKDKKPFNFVILDFLIPNGMNGKETLDKIRQIDPNAKIILSSGYNNGILDNYKELGFNLILKKPYTIFDLRRAIKTITKKKVKF